MRSRSRIKRKPFFVLPTLSLLGLLLSQQPAFAQVPSGLGSLGPADRALAEQTMQNALETLPSRGRATWRGSESGAHGSVTPLVTYKSVNGHWCRRFEESIITLVSGLIREATACRKSDSGRWVEVDPAQ